MTELSDINISTFEIAKLKFYRIEVFYSVILKCKIYFCHLRLYCNSKPPPAKFIIYLADFFLSLSLSNVLMHTKDLKCYFKFGNQTEDT